MEDSKTKNSLKDLHCTVAPEDAGMTVKGVLRRHNGISIRLIRRIIHGVGVHGEIPESGKDGGVFLNGDPARFSDKVKVGDEITLVFPEEKSGLEAEKMDISVLYEDEDLLAINKAPGIVVHPTKGHPNGTIANGLVYYMQEKGETYKPRFINRLDMGTSGVLLIGKNSHAQNYFTKQSALGRIDKKYIAVVHGIVEEDSGTIDEPIGLASDTTPERIVRADGAPSVTHFAVEKRIDDGILPRTVLRIQIDTGRTHQIRVHMAYIGHPVISDNLYGNEPSAAVIADTGSDSLQKSVPADAAERPFIARQALHAHTLSFPHPKTAERITITAPLPDDIAALKELSSRA